MPVPFGFSVGDFVTVMQLTSKIISSLKDVGGSASEYQHAVVELESLKRLLDKVTQLTITEDNAIQVNALRGLALACEPCLQEFHRKLKSYEESIGPYAPRRSLKGTFRKVKWAFLGSEEFAQFRKFIAMKVLCLNLLLSMHVFESTSNKDSRQHVGNFSLLDEVAKIRESMERLELTSQRRSPQLAYQASLRPIQDKVEDIAEKLESNLTPVSSALTSVGRAVFSFNNVLGQIIDFLGSFQRETKVALQKIIQTNMQIYALLLTSQNSPAAGPSIPSDTILFEDALGRTISLPYQWFRHWETFEGLLRAEFKGVPGEAKVLEGKYHLIDTKGTGAIIKKEDWNRAVFPGSSVTMSVIISQIRWRGGLCPRPSCGERRIELDRPRLLVTCKSCNLKYYPSRERLEGDSKLVTVLTEDDEVTWSQSTQDLEVFGARPLPKDPEESAAILALLESADITTGNADISALSSATQSTPPREKVPTSYQPLVGSEIQKPTSEKIDTPDKKASKFRTPLDKWLAQTEAVGLDPNMVSDGAISDTMRQEEASEIEHFKRAHIKQWRDTPEDDNDRVPSGADPNWRVETDEAIYHRNICDRFPLLPSWLSHRLAKCNVERAKRLPRAFYEHTSSSHDEGSENLENHLPRAVYAHTSSSHDGDSENLENYPHGGDPPSRPALASHDDGGRNQGDQREEYPILSPSSLNLPLEISFWSGKTKRKRPASTLSRSSHSNNSLQLPDAPAGSPSIQTHCSRSLGSDEAGFMVPPPPVDLGKHNTFICDICNNHVVVLRRRDWQTHVLRDLRPYSCIFQYCPTPSKTYISRAGMLSHIFRFHPARYSYRCGRCPPSEERMDRAGLRAHMKQKHPGQWAYGVEASIPPKDYLQKEILERNCHFCDKALRTTKEFVTHISQHLERIAFAVLARPYQKWHFYDDFASEGSAASLEIAHFIRNNSVAIVKQFLKDEILTKTHCGNYALWIAAQGGNETIVWLLLQHGFDVSEKNPLVQGRTALHYAAEAGHDSVVEMLLKAGADPFAQLNDGTTALALAARNGHVSILRTFQEQYSKRNDLLWTDLRRAWILAAENDQCEALGALHSILDGACQNGAWIKGQLEPYHVLSIMSRGIVDAIKKNKKGAIQEATSYAWSAPGLLNMLHREAALQIVKWVLLSLGNRSLSHILLSSPWIERDWQSTSFSSSDKPIDEVTGDIAKTLLTALNLAGYQFSNNADSAISNGDHLQALLKQHPEFIQLVYRDIARAGLQEPLAVLLRESLPPHPKTLLTLVQHKQYAVLRYLLSHFSSHFREIDKINALIGAIQLGRIDPINSFIETRSLPTSPSVAADRLLLACIQRGEPFVLLEQLLNHPVPLFCAAAIAAAKAAATGRTELLRLLETCCHSVDATDERPPLSTISGH